jgi:hypothetical protein
MELHSHGELPQMMPSNCVVVQPFAVDERFALDGAAFIADGQRGRIRSFRPSS